MKTSQALANVCNLQNYLKFFLKNIIKMTIDLSSVIQLFVKTKISQAKDTYGIIAIRYQTPPLKIC